MKYFGTDGFRGKVNEVLTVDHAIQIGKYLGYHFKQQKKEVKCVIGKDTRRSSYMYEYGLVAGLTSTGADVYLLHVTTTPSVAHVTRTEDFDFGIMITASHNPYHDNGIKVIDSNGHKMDEGILEKIEQFIDGEIEIPLSDFENIGKCQDYMQGRNKYMNFLMSLMPYSLNGYRVGLDCANGASFMLAKNVFDMVGAKTFVINAEPDGFNINRECGSTHLAKLQKFVVDNHLDVGFAFDGDADRCLAVDEHGNVVDGDMIIYLYGCFLKEKGALNGDTVVTTIMSNMGITKALKERGISNVQTSVGDKYVAAELNANNFSIGGEQSGHIIFNKNATTGDGILTALKVMEVMVEKKSSLSLLVHDIEIYPQKLINIKVKNNMDALLETAEVKGAVAHTEADLGDDGRVVLRKSGTEPLIRIMVEARTEEQCLKYAEYIRDTIQKMDN